MADNVIKVSVTSTKSQRVSVSSSQVATNITASPDLGLYWSQKAKNWAVSENIVDNEDYSSKYYANKSKESANTAKSYLDTVQDTYNSFTSDASSSISELIEARNAGIEEINEAVASGKDEINSTKTTILNDIEFVADGEKKEIEDLAENAKDDIKSTGFYMRDDKLYFINSKGEEEEFQSGGSGYTMFDTVLKDHVLTYEESKGLALQGTYVYKEAVAGSRYGYADFYNKCLEEKEAGTATEVTLGESTITMYVNPNGHQFYDIADLEVVNTWFNTYGYAWFYGIDTENERIFLPRNNWFEQATGDVSEVCQSVEAGLPNITGAFVTEATQESGCFQHTSSASTNTGATGGSTDHYITFDASRSSAVYGKSDTVQPNAIKKLLYICVGNTGSVSSVTDVVDVTTTENDTTPLFTGMYFDFKPNNVSWLKADRTVDGADIYAFVYNELVNELTTPKYGLKVIETKNMIVGVDYSEYWKVNQTDMTFTTPTAISNKALSGAVKGNGMTIGLTNGTQLLGVYGATEGLSSNTGTTYGSNIGTTRDSSGQLATNLKTVGITTDPTKSGIIAEQSTAQLYFKVANAVQNLELLDVGRVMEDAVLRSSLVEAQVVVETYSYGSSWYRIWSDGWCEQGGIVVSSSNGKTVTLLKEYKDTGYTILTTPIGEMTNDFYSIGTLNITTTGFLANWDGEKSDPSAVSWKTCGYIK